MTRGAEIPGHYQGRAGVRADCLLWVKDRRAGHTLWSGGATQGEATGDRREPPTEGAGAKREDRGRQEPDVGDEEKSNAGAKRELSPEGSNARSVKKAIMAKTTHVAMTIRLCGPDIPHEEIQVHYQPGLAAEDLIMRICKQTQQDPVGAALIVEGKKSRPITTSLTRSVRLL